MINIILILVILCGLTCLVEAIPLLFFNKAKRRKWINTSFLCNFMTNPILNILLVILSIYITNQALYFLTVILLEIIVIIFEAFIFYNVMGESFKKCLAVSLLVNMVSFILGLLLFKIINILDQPTYSLDNEVL